jgi:restriction system protein
MRELKCVMSDFGAEQRLFVAWGGFKRSVLSEARKNFFEIRLWDAGKLVEAILNHYSQFTAELKAELPLKQIWTLVNDVDE